MVLSRSFFFFSLSVTLLLGSVLDNLLFFSVL